jgi:diaminopimelate epimerase
MIKVPFFKMQGAGNDFIVIDHKPGLDYPLLARKVCDRHMGIGADGVLILDESSSCDYKMRIVNADGSEAEMCGNGARCMAVYIAFKFAVVPEMFTIETLAGVIRGTAKGDMAQVQLSDPVDYRPNIELKLGDQKIIAHAINTGVPHAIIFLQGLHECDVNGLGRVIRQHKAFAPRGTNVNFVERLKEGFIELRTYERGVESETLSCGTGSVAAAIVAYLQGQPALDPTKSACVRVATRSGEMLEVSFDLDIRDSKPLITNVWLKGSGRVICKGEYYY